MTYEEWAEKRLKDMDLTEEIILVIREAWYESRRQKMVLMSTPRDKDNFFHELWMEGR